MAATQPTPAYSLTEEQFHRIARALADPRRFAILRQIAAASESLPCSGLAENAIISPPTISHHLRELTEAGLITVARRGRFADLSLRRDIYRAYIDRLSELYATSS